MNVHKMSQTSNPRCVCLAGLVVVLALTACDSLSHEPTASVPPVAVQQASLSDDGRVLTLEFVGAAQFDPEDPCTRDYKATIDRDSEELRFSVHEVPHPGANSETFCDLIGYPRTVEVELDPPFTGQRLVETGPDQLEVDLGGE